MGLASGDWVFEAGCQGTRSWGRSCWTGRGLASCVGRSRMRTTARSESWSKILRPVALPIRWGEQALLGGAEGCEPTAHLPFDQRVEQQRQADDRDQGGDPAV